ncbi:hypothetical protein QZH41_017632, partial [Actinostola sp. cb2023]
MGTLVRRNLARVQANRASTASGLHSFSLPRVLASRNGRLFDDLAGLLPPQEKFYRTFFDNPRVYNPWILQLKLVNPSESRLIHLVTQMKWRLQEGQGEAIYEIGVEDNGAVVGLPEKELQASLKTLDLMASKLGAATSVLRRQCIDTSDASRHVAEVLVRQIPDDQQFIDIRMAVLGNVESGKSTLLGVLTYDELDNGHGRARLNLFRHLHEIQSGRTSSISHEILGFSSSGEVINYSESRSAEDICEQSSKLITFIDLAGHHKYMKTTIFGLTGYSPDFAMLLIAGNSGIVGTTKEHLGLTMALRVPTYVVITKIDVCTPAMIQRTVTIVERILKSPGCNKVPLRVQTEDDAVVAVQNFASHHCESIVFYRITPIFTVSCVTGENLDLLKKFLNILQPTTTSADKEKLAQAPTQYKIDETFNVPGTGPVVLGTLTSGIMREGDKLVVGPLYSGQFDSVQVTSLKRNRASCRVVRAGQSASVALKGIERHMLRRGMVLADPQLNPRACLVFWAEIYLLFHHTSIHKRFQSTVYIGNVIQNAIIIDMNKWHRNDELTELDLEEAALDSATLARRTIYVYRSSPYRSFSGDILEWVPWWDQFKTCIHENETLGDRERFNYLLMYVKGIAKRAIEYIEVTSENYARAIEALQKRYGRKRIVVEHLIDSILSIEKKDKVNAHSLRYLYDTMVNRYHTLESYEPNLKHCHRIIVPILQSKFPQAIRRKWEYELSKIENEEDDKKITVEYLFNFLRSHVMSEEAAETSHANFQLRDIEERRDNALKPGRTPSRNNRIPSSSAIALNTSSKPEDAKQRNS